MIDRLKELFKFSAKVGWYLPAAYDQRTKGPSVSLLFAHVANFVAIVAIIKNLLTSTEIGGYMAMGYSGLMLVFYLLRSIGKAKIGKDGIELEDDDDEEKGETK